jgi:LmbE family N-acetylglucosaminyl deacetylase
MNKDILAIVSHPDDETFGCGGTLSIHAMQGKKVQVLCMTCNPINRKNELYKAALELGISKPIILENETIQLNKKIINKVSGLIVDIRPRIVITHIPFDYHREHRLTFEIVKEAIEWAGHQTIYDKPWVVERLLLMEVNTLIPTPHVIVDITDSIERKKKTINVYTSQLDKFSWDYYQKFNMKKAEMRGIQGRCQYAEAFQIEPIAQNSPFFPLKSIKSLI